MINRYEIIIYWSDEDKAFIADVPELPGCMAHGDTYESALGSIKSAMDLWINLKFPRFLTEKKPKSCVFTCS